MQNDPPYNPINRMIGSPAAEMYLNLIVAGVLLLEALVYYALLRRHRRGQRVPVLLSLGLVAQVGLVALALALAHALWSFYAQSSKAPHFPPPWLDSVGGFPESYVYLTWALAALAAIVAFPLCIAVFASPRR